MKKSLLLAIFIAFILSVTFASAASVRIEKEMVSDVVITELNKPAIFSFSITNLGETDNFEIYSLVGVDISPRGMFQILAGETKKIQVEIFPDERFKRRPGIITFTYKIRGQNSGIQDDTLTINIVDWEEALSIMPENINPESEKAVIDIENRVNFNFPEIQAEFDSAFFKQELNFSINPLELKKIEIPIDKESMKKLVAGKYILTSTLDAEGVIRDFESIIKFTEQSGLSVSEKTSGIFFHKKIIEKTNEGNVPVVAQISMKKDIISRLFTTFNINPEKAERNWFIVDYTWTRDLKPAESLQVIANTNYLYPFIIILAIIIGIMLIRIYTAADLIINKRVSYVKAKGGEFALKVTIIVKAKNYINKIAVVDRLPAIVKLFERYGASSPSKYDERTRRLEWDIESLNKGEERIFSYIVYSKLGFVGKFELPATTALYERDGDIKEVSSNKAFFMNEPRRHHEE